MTNLFKNGFQRLRPCSNPEINTIILKVEVPLVSSQVTLQYGGYIYVLRYASPL
jgi:hypothetical protein